MKKTGKNTKRSMKTSTTTKVIAGIAGLAVVGGITAAAAKGFHGGHHGKHGYGAEIFSEIDADGDNSISRAEVDAFLDGIRAENDANGNGAIDLQEFEGVFLEQARPMMVDRFQHLDDNGDGEISADEVSVRVDKLMAWADKNDDGVVELKELKRKGRHHGRGHGGHDHDDD